MLRICRFCKPWPPFCRITGTHLSNRPLSRACQARNDAHFAANRLVRLLRAARLGYNAAVEEPLSRPPRPPRSRVREVRASPEHGIPDQAVPAGHGALEIQYIEEHFGEFPRKKTAQEIIDRLHDREFLILMAEAALPDDPARSCRSPTRWCTRCARGSASRSSPIWSRGCATASASRAARSSTAGLAARAATGAARGTSAPSPRSRRPGPTCRASTRWSSRRRTASTTCAARSISSSST
jgi:hypothetical protein